MLGDVLADRVGRRPTLLRGIALSVPWMAEPVGERREAQRRVVPQCGAFRSGGL
ncbi:hypothetical protein ACIOEW_31730 [Streptomyces sp. NPDC087901]|uniref:hypothetical protein n=1 Tax=Streptomyces sp. NPDC087901 TaxID=3365818 RepID=UPI00380E2739